MLLFDRVSGLLNSISLYTLWLSSESVTDRAISSRTDHSLVFNISGGSLEGLLSWEANGSLISNGANRIAVQLLLLKREASSLNRILLTH
jgi:hypothetical protein